MQSDDELCDIVSQLEISASLPTTTAISVPETRSETRISASYVRNNENEAPEEAALLLLTPYIHQVGGHASFLRFSEKALCIVFVNQGITVFNQGKPLDLKEQLFYEMLEGEHTEVLPFIASYLGLVNVTFRDYSKDGNFTDSAPIVMLEQNKHLIQDSENGDITIQQKVFREALSPRSIKARYARLSAIAVANIPSLRSPARVKLLSAEQCSPSGSQSDLSIFRMSDDEGGKEEANIDFKETKKDDAETSQPADSPDNNKATFGEDGQYFEAFNPWSIHLYNSKIAKLQSEIMRSNSKSQPQNSGNPFFKATTTQQFILMEDLTYGLSCPCILDLKMGTRQHGVYASVEKKTSQERKCDKSTSKRLGVRICGMQVYFYPNLDLSV